MNSRAALAAALLLSGCSARPKLIVVCLGDSITAGAGAFIPWPRVLDRRLEGRVQTVNLGMNGDTTGQMLERFRQRPPRPVDWVVVLGGINDVTKGVPVEEVKGNLAAIWDEAKARGARVAAVTLLPEAGAWTWKPDRQPLIDELNAWIRAESRRRGMALIDAWAAFGAPDDPRKLAPELDSGDHLHLGQRGADRLAELVAPLFQ